MTAIARIESSQRRAVGRPAGEVYLALLQAAQAIKAERADTGEGATLLELSKRACVGYAAARQKVAALKRYGHLTITGQREVAYRNRPVAEYAPARKVSEGFDDSGRFVLAQCLAGWGK